MRCDAMSQFSGKLLHRPVAEFSEFALQPRYMIWRETISSTATLGIRIEGVKYSDGSTSNDFKTTKSEDAVRDAFRLFTANNPKAIVSDNVRSRVVSSVRSINDVRAA